jgi:predicted small metal-binding protein
LKRFVCDRIMPGCGGVFTGATDQEVLDQILEHVAVVHGIGTPALPFIELVMTHTRPFTPTGSPRRLRVVAADDPDRRSVIVTGRGASGRFMQAPAPAISGLAVPDAVPTAAERALPDNVRPLMVDGFRPATPA